MDLNNVPSATKQSILNALPNQFTDQLFRKCVQEGDLSGVVARLETLRDDYDSQTQQQHAAQVASGDPHFKDAALASIVLAGIYRMLAISI